MNQAQSAGGPRELWTVQQVVYVDPILRIYRSMRPAPQDDMLPAVGRSARTLGVRGGVGYGTDIAVDDDGHVYPRTGGLSVAPNDPASLPEVRRPPELGGKGKDPVWMLELAELELPLVYRPDPVNPLRHGFIEPREPMPWDDFQRLLAGTQQRWRRVI